MNYKHGLSETRLYRIWRNMIGRCENAEKHNFYLYGGRGISVCDEWREDFVSFHNWSIENGYSDKLTIDRVDNDAGYCPSNCRWVSTKTQSRNKRSCYRIEYNGETYNAEELSSVIGVSPQSIRKKIKQGLSAYDIRDIPRGMKISNYVKLKEKGEI